MLYLVSFIFKYQGRVNSGSESGSDVHDIDEDDIEDEEDQRVDVVSSSRYMHCSAAVSLFLVLLVRV